MPMGDCVLDFGLDVHNNEATAAYIFSLQSLKYPTCAEHTRGFSWPPVQPVLNPHRVTDFQKAGALCRTTPAKVLRLLASWVSAEGHTKCTRSTPIQLSAQLAPALCFWVIGKGLSNHFCGRGVQFKT